MDARNSSPALALALILTAACTAVPRPETGAAPASPPPTTPAVEAPSEQEAPSEPESVVPEPLAERFCAAVHTLQAERRKACCGTAAESLAEVCVRHLSPALRRGTVTLDAAAVDRCAADTAVELEGCGWVRPLLPKPAAACAGLLQGTLAAGSACASSLECADGLYCRGLSQEGPGRCAAPAAARAPCEAPADNLAAFTASRGDPRHRECDGQCVRGRCLPFAAAGEPCSGRASCRPGLNCLDGRCADRPLPAIGEPCAGGAGCGDGYCRDGVCAPVKERGEPCRLPFECRAMACEKPAGSTDGVCGDPCGAASGSR
ncbi:MAG TPA: hypothetical protein VGG06_28950 [Thermoanaerobaculia bacterium]|jgi:hypothetical protein